MTFISSILKKLSSLAKKNKVAPTTESSIWNHNHPSTSENDNLQKFEFLQKKVQEEKESRSERRALRRQNRFLGFQNELLAVQNQRLCTEKHSLRAERQAIAAKKNEMARKLRKQKRISEYYRRRLAEVRSIEREAQKSSGKHHDHSD